MRPFALVIFVPGEDTTFPQLCQLAKTIRKRSRFYDVVGRVDTQRLGVILPGTDSEGAWTFANAIFSELAGEGLEFDVEVHVPIMSSPNGAHAGTNGRRGGPGAPGSGHNGHAQTNGANGTDSSNDNGREPVNGRESSNGHSTRNGHAHQPTPEPVNGNQGAEGASPSNGNVAAPLNGNREKAPTNGRSARSDREAPDDQPEPSLLRSVRADGQHVRVLEPAPPVTPSLRKRALDVAVSATLLVLLVPLFAIVAIAIKLTSPGPVFFSQKRAGLGGRPFDFFKFRTMYVNSDAQKSSLRSRNEKDGPIFKMRNDPRITPLGRILRRSSIDELPQLWNVLRGDMSLVGPRPPTLDEVEKYEPWQRQRLGLIGGLTCIWQVSGRSEIGFTDWVRMDIRYARERGARMDLALLAKTAGAVLSRRGAY